ncbi:hypothetical protein FA13DRAFT_1736428 [Coprinellus micaceus]|uniref:MYND-type domain-containing protein n=1 Tax=Coprinellus micaceus TaxID=71717 RepID=A0A4Y7T0R8_COPMI|nr:hypothetical protein FA13DRAFT_1736428 [Coprinellus micaceus]
MGYRKGSFGTTITWIHPYQSFLKKGAQRILCHNLKHRDSVGQGPNITPSAGERLCARCRSVAYCSRECQLEDWRSFHRSECPAMSRHFYDHSPSKGQYRYRYRKLHANILRYGFESAEVMLRCMHVPGLSTGYDPDSCRVAVGGPGRSVSWTGIDSGRLCTSSFPADSTVSEANVRFPSFHLPALV